MRFASTLETFQISECNAAPDALLPVSTVMRFCVGTCIGRLGVGVLADKPCRPCSIVAVPESDRASVKLNLTRRTSLERAGSLVQLTSRGTLLVCSNSFQAAVLARRGALGGGALMYSTKYRSQCADLKVQISSRTRCACQSHWGHTVTCHHMTCSSIEAHAGSKSDWSFVVGCKCPVHFFLVTSQTDAEIIKA